MEKNEKKSSFWSNLGGLIVLIIIISGIVNYCSDKDDTPTSAVVSSSTEIKTTQATTEKPIYTVTITLEYEKNILMNNAQADIKVNGKKIGHQYAGDTITYEMQLKEGTHTIKMSWGLHNSEEREFKVTESVTDFNFHAVGTIMYGWNLNNVSSYIVVD